MTTSACQAPAVPTAPRNLIICCDGTNNQFGPENTNVIRLIQALDLNPAKQHHYYDPGVGTLPEPGTFGAVRKWLSKVAGLAFGAGLNWKVQQAYTYLMEHWEPGDRVFLFGFSRGAYTARVLAGMLHTLGLLPPGGHNLVPYALRLYKSLRKVSRLENVGAENDLWALCREFRQTFARPVSDTDGAKRFSVHFLGVWDTVSSVGWVWDPLRFPYTRTNPSVAIVRHSVSVDERRAFFRQNLLKPADSGSGKPKQDFKEYWFAGVHSDVGGGYPNRNGYLWQEPFQWMLDEAMRAGLRVDAGLLAKVMERSPDSPPTWKDEQHESLNWKWALAEYFPKLPDSSKKGFRLPRINNRRARYIQDGDLIYRSVLQRIRQLNGRYRPRNFSPHFVEKILALQEPLPLVLPFEWSPRPPGAAVPPAALP